MKQGIEKLIRIISVPLVSFCAMMDSSQPAQAQTCDIKLDNGSIYLFDDKFVENIATTLTITDNLISFVGNGGGGDCTETIDLGGRTVIPGLNDTHVHYFSRINAGGHVVAEVDTVQTQQELIDTLNAAIEIQNVPPVSGSITVRNFLVTEGGNDETGWDLSALDQVDRPVLLVGTGFGGSPGQLNTSAKTYFSSVGLDSSGADGSVGDTGDMAAHLLGEETTADRQEDYLDGNRWTASVGITAMQNFIGSPLDYPELTELYDNGTAFLRFHSAVNSTSQFQDAVAANNHQGNNPDMLRLTSIGEFGSGAQFGQPPDAAYQAGAEDMANADITTHQHALTAGEVDGYISSWQTIDASIGMSDLRWRLDHVREITSTQMDQIVAIGGNISVHGITRPSDLRTIYDHDINVSTGSDGGNFTTINPWIVVDSWVTGSNAISVYEALYMYTIGGAYDTFDEDKYGSLEVGKFADLVVMADDPFTTNDLINVTSALTIVDGDIVYSDGSIISCEGESASGLWFRNLDRASCAGAIFADGFESGDTSMWSQEVSQTTVMTLR